MTMTWMGALANSYGFDLHGEPVPRRRLGIYFHGVNGTMYSNYGMFKIVPEGDRMKGMEPPKESIPAPRRAMNENGSTRSRPASNRAAVCSITPRSTCR